MAYTKEFWKAVPERCLRGAAVAVAAVWFGGDVVFDVMNVNTWGDIGSVAISGAIGSLLLSLTGGAIGKGDGPSFSGVENVPPTVP